MATQRTRWLLSILLVNLPNCFTVEVSPRPLVPPSRPECYILCGEQDRSEYIHCNWDPGPDYQFPTTYSLHWVLENRKEGNVTSLNRSSGAITREQYSSNEELHVWVETKSQYGSAKSQTAIFNVQDIIKPPPPKITVREQEQLEWHSFCNELQLSLGTCDVRNRPEEDLVWLEHEGGFLNTYALDSLKPCRVYEFQVRCACDIGLKSDWSAIHKIRVKETTPVGELDIWRDCGLPLASFDCVLTWRKLPKSQACGVILGYEVKLFYNDGTIRLVNVSTTEPNGQLSCDEMKCRFNSTPNSVSSVYVSAFNAHGAMVPSHLDMATPGIEKNEHAINLKMNEENLTVSWDLPFQLPESFRLKEYVVQYKQAGCPPGQGFDWIKVTKNQTTVFFKGQFKEFKPFRVSLFAVSHNKKVHHLSSVIGYSIEGKSSRVPSFKVFSIAANQVTLLWEPVPLCKQNGVIQYYQIGLDGQNVYNVSASQQRKEYTFELKDLSSGQDYEVWIRAVTGAGPGEKASTRFKTKQQEKYALFFAILVVFLAIPFLIFRGNKVCPFVTSCLSDKVPDPRNSHIFREMKHQINNPSRICKSINEPHPMISMLEIVEIKPDALQSAQKKLSDSDGLSRPMVRDGGSQLDCQDDQSEDAVTEERGRKEHGYGREEYSKMVDSDEERDREEDRDDCGSSSEEEHLSSGYEKHFMPTAVEILEV